MKKNKNVYVMVTAAMFLAIAYILPFLTGQISQIGNMLCPMHIPVLLCGYFCGVGWGGLVGFTAPLLRSLTLGMPVLFPIAVCMSIELAGYGIVSGYLHRILPKRKKYVYISLLLSMIAGRVLWGIAMSICVGIGNNSFGMKAFLNGALLNAIPGIILQIVLVPIVVMSLDKDRWNKKGM